MRKTLMQQNGSKTSLARVTLRLGSSTIAISGKCDPETLRCLLSVISSLVSVFGPLPCASPAGQTNDPFGPEAAPASHSAEPEDGKASKTNVICGLSGTVSSKSANLQQSLASKLRAGLQWSGSTLCQLTWKTRTTPLGRQICALRASVLRTGDNVFTGWPTPQAHDNTGRSHGQKSKRR